MQIQKILHITNIEYKHFRFRVRCIPLKLHLQIFLFFYYFFFIVPMHSLLTNLRN